MKKTFILTLFMMFCSITFGQNVAKIVETGFEYPTLRKAFENVKDNQTITFLADNTLGEDVTVSKTVTIDGAGKKFKGRIQLGGQGKTIIIKNVHFCDYNSEYALNTVGVTYLTVENCTATNLGWGLLQISSSTSLTTLRNVTVKNSTYGVKTNYSNKVVLENVDIEARTAAYLNTNYGTNKDERSVEIINSHLNKLGTWVKGKSETTFIFKGENKVDEFIIDEKYEIFKLYNLESTLTAPGGQYVYTCLPTDQHQCVIYEEGTYHHHDQLNEDGYYDIIAKVASKDKINGKGVEDTKYYKSLSEAIAAAGSVENVWVVANSVGAGSVINQDLTIEFNNFKHTFNKAVGSNGTETNGFQILAGNNVTLQNGNLTSKAVAQGEGKQVKMLVQNYANLTLNNMNLVDNTAYIQYVLSNNSGNVNIIGNTSITANGKDENSKDAVAFDVCKYGNYPAPTVNVATTGTITGAIEVSEAIKYNLNISAGTFTNKIMKDWCHEDYVPTQNGSNWTVRNGNFVAEVQGKVKAKYETIAEAVVRANGEEGAQTITVLADNTTSTPAVVTNDLTFDLNGKAITTAENVYPVIRIQKGANVTVTGEGSITNATDYVFVLGSADKETAGNLTIENGTFLGETTVASVTKGLLTINGGEFKISDKETYDYAYLINCFDDNYKNGTAKVEIKGGTFYGFNPEDNAAEGEGTNFCPQTPVRYIAVENPANTFTVQEGTWVAKIENGTKFQTLAEAVEAGTKVTLLEDAEGAGVVIDKNVTIDFAGYTYTFNKAVGSKGTETLGLQIMEGNNVTLQNGTLTSTAVTEGKEVKMLVQNYANLTLNNMNLVDNTDHILYALSNNSGIVSIKGETNITTDKVAFDVCKYGNYEAPVVNVTTTGFINGAIEVTPAIANNLTITNGTYTADYTDYCADGYVCNKDGENYTVEESPVAMIGDEVYATLAEAVAAANDEDVITILRDVRNGAGVVINKGITIDFNKKTYALKSGVGSEGTETNGFQILAGNNVTLKNGALEVNETFKLYFYILVQNYANLTVNNMMLDGEFLDKYSATDGDSYVLSNNSGKVSIEGTTNITANTDGDKAFAFDVCKYASYEAPVVTITSKGTFSGNIEVSEGLTDNLHIQAGTYTLDVQTWCDEGYFSFANSDNTLWTVSGPYVAKIEDENGNETYYETLQDAINDAKDGDVIDIVADAEGEGVIIDKDITIDFNDHTYTVTDGAGDTDSGIIIEEGADVTLKDGEIKSEGEGVGTLIENNGDLTLEDMDLDGSDKNVDDVISNNGNVDITGDTNIKTNGNEDSDAIDNNGDATVNINTTGTIEGDIDAEGSEDNISIVGGKFTEDVTDFCEDGYVCKKEEGEEGEEYYVVGKSNVAKIAETGVEYLTLAQAVAAAEKGQTVVLLRSVENGAGVVINKDITIDFAGKVYQFKSAVGSKGTESNGFQILKDNTVKLQNGVLEVNATFSHNFYILVQNYANLTVKSMYLNGENLDKWSETDGDSYVLSNNSGEVHIVNAIIVANEDGDKAFAFDVDKTAVVYVEGEDTNIAGKVAVTGGQYNLNIKAGTFSHEIMRDWCHEDYVPTQNEDATWTVRLGNFVAEVEGQVKAKYETVEEAIVRANGIEGAQTILVLQNTAANELVNVTDEIINLNGKELTANIIGTIETAGGLWTTPTTASSNGYKMIGDGAQIYQTADATIVMGATEIVMAEGEVTLVPAEWWTLQGQNLTIGAEAEFTIPANSKFNVMNGTTVTVKGEVVNEGTLVIYGSAVVTEEATLVVNGEVVLAAMEATLKAEEGLNVTTNVETCVVRYVVDTYHVVPVQTLELAQGWNWFSSYIVADDLLGQVQNGIGANGIQIKNHAVAFNNYDATHEAWVGDLKAISLKEMYMVKVNADVELVVNGFIANPAEQEIEISSKWNWIGYPVTKAMSVNEALKGLVANEGDIIKAHNGAFTTYINNEWIEIEGASNILNTMEPGNGYMYYSYAGGKKDFVYPTSSSRSAAKANVTAENNHWVANASAFANNMTIVAALNVEGVEMGEGVEVAAFVNGEVRGSARPFYVESIDSYVMFLSVYGNDQEEVTFKYIDLYTEEEYTLSNKVAYADNAIIGSIAEPMTLCYGTMGIGENAANTISLYPNPTTTHAAINFETVCDVVEVFNSLGVRVAEYRNVDSIDGLEAAGVYVIRVTNGETVQNCRLIVK